MTCPNCSAELSEGSQFCSRCGARVASQVPVASQAPVASQVPVPPLPAEGAAGQAAAGASRMKVAAGVVSIASAALILLACALPYVRVKSFTGSHFTSVSIFNSGPGSSASNLWFAVEPVGVAAFAIAGGILLMTLSYGRLRVVVAGTLAAFGIQTIMLFLGYALGPDFGTSQEGIAGALGMLGGYLLAGAGVVAAVSRGALSVSLPRR